MAKGNRKKEDKPLYRAVKFEIFPTQQQQAVLWRISAHLCQLYNMALQQRKEAYEKFIKPVDKKIKILREECEKKGLSFLWTEEGIKSPKRESEKQGIDSKLIQWVIDLRDDLYKERKKAFDDNRDNLTFYGQVNQLTSLRAGDSEYGAMLRTWQEETLDSVNAEFRSFVALRKNGDMDANSPNGRQEGFFCKIPGRNGFRIRRDHLFLSLGCLSEDSLSCSIPEYQKKKLSNAVKLNKFELYRDQRDPSKVGRFWVSIAYEVQKPKEVPFPETGPIFLAIGASVIGLVYFRGEQLIKLSRPDKFWKPKIDEVQRRMKRTQKGSRKYRRLALARRKMFSILHRQQKQSRREAVQKLLRYGSHFVVTELIVRSKPGKLADASKAERGGSLGTNWAAQSTGSIGFLVAQLEDKAREIGGSVKKMKSPPLSPEEKVRADRKLIIARKMRESFLSLT